MLESLSIKNYAIIENLTVEFKKGFNILTGETGAGKSIIVDALGLVLGERASPSFIRKGSSECEVVAVFDISKNKEIKKILKNNELYQDESLIIKRKIFSDGKSKCLINDTAITLQTLKSIGDLIVDIHGQHEHQSLIRPQNQLYILDEFGELSSLRDDFKRDFEELQNKKREYENLLLSDTERKRKIDLYDFCIKEISSAKLSIDEEKELEQEFNILNNAEKLFNLSKEAYEVIFESDGSAVEKLGKTNKLLENLAGIDEKLKNSFENLKTGLYTIESVADELREYRDSIEFNPKRLDEILERKDLIGKLKKKYGDTIQKVLDYKEEMEKELKGLIHSDENREELKKDIDDLTVKLEKKAKELSKKRKNTGELLSKKIQNELHNLGMEKARFVIQILEEEAKSTGVDNVEFLISPNVGEEPKGLSDVASGGELSRTMLAIKTVLAESDKIPVIIFDEIDAGVGGPMSNVLGKKLAQLSRFHQVLCITHFPTIASYSDEHYYVSKHIEKNRTITSVKNLSHNERVYEIARMLGDKEITDISIKHAKQLLASKK